MVQKFLGKFLENPNSDLIQCTIPDVPGGRSYGMGIPDYKISKIGVNLTKLPLFPEISENAVPPATGNSGKCRICGQMKSAHNLTQSGTYNLQIASLFTTLSSL